MTSQEFYFTLQSIKNNSKNMLPDELHKEQRWVVSIKIDYYNRVYFRNDMTQDFFNKWEWYFKYRAALLQVQNPKSNVRYDFGAYDYILPEADYRIKLKNVIRKRKSQLTEYKCKINYAVENWNEIFPIEQNPYWKKVQDKLKKLELELQTALDKQKELDENGYNEEQQPILCINQLTQTGY